MQRKSGLPREEKFFQKKNRGKKVEIVGGGEPKNIKESLVVGESATRICYKFCFWQNFVLFKA